MTATYDEATKYLIEAIELEAAWARRAVQPFVLLFRGTETYLNRGGRFTEEQRDALRKRVQTARSVYSKDSELATLIAVVSKLTKLT